MPVPAHLALKGGHLSQPLPGCKFSRCVWGLELSCPHLTFQVELQLPVISICSLLLGLEDSFFAIFTVVFFRWCIKHCSKKQIWVDWSFTEVCSIKHILTQEQHSSPDLSTTVSTSQDGLLGNLPWLLIEASSGNTCFYCPSPLMGWWLRCLCNALLFLPVDPTFY